ncbi:MAG: ADP-ribosylglycohydrolase family protein [Clostridium sp.]
MKAWEIELDIRRNAKPVILTSEEQTWDSYKKTCVEEDSKLRLLWNSNVPGSHAPERVIIGAVQSVYNMGYETSNSDSLVLDGIKAVSNDDIYELYKITTKLLANINNADKIKGHPYWDYTQYDSFDQYLNAVDFKELKSYDINSNDFEDKTYAAWIGQIVAGALGTAIEGYTTERIIEKFGIITGYVREPNTYNDDITYELAFLKAFEKFGNNVTSIEISEEWVALIPAGWSAEDIALKNLKLGIYPPMSGYLNNPYREWIGAQMRGVICGMVAPGNLKMAAQLAWKDAVISHHNNGVFGEVFNAIMASYAYIEKDIRIIVEESINLIPKDSEYYSIIKLALDLCKEYTSWETPWSICEEKFKEYNWIHAYPNAAAQVIALWFGNGNFDKTMTIIAMEGQDVDCNAAQIATIVAVAKGRQCINKEKWIDPIGDELNTYMRTMETLSINELCKWTVQCTRKA